ncbi:ABC transporter [Virgisporangium aliadipatigenens]|uniref:ABC transporter n=1 Tax=Virgisporangium aliadipatigenens TaxID=741659 RepID=A0A8J4DME9_9ACTN|nr:FtsX-like permease family protein [Virgisporangium aliadipatigenens]GIJ43314.1 ABC transporter [Virgisporangium aliadipatigenens]
MLRDLRAHKGRLAMMLAAIVLGVGFMVATWVVSDSTARTAGGGAARTDVAICAQALEPESGFTPAERDRLAALPGVTRTNGVRLGYAALVAADGKLAGVWPDRAGTGWDDSQRFVLADGRAPRAGELALGEQVAAAAGLTVGDTARVILADGSSVRPVVVGLFTYRPLGAEPIPSLAFAGDESAVLLGDRFDRVELATASAADETRLALQVKSIVDGEREVRTGAELTAERERMVADNARSVREVMLVFAAVALVAGMFVIANTFTMLVAQRTRQFALLRAVGASARQVRVAVLTEAAVIGVLGSTVGAVLGVLLGIGALAAFRPEGTTVAYTVSPFGIAAGYLAGVLVTVVSAYGSARRGAAVAPVAALRTDAALPRRALLSRAIVGGVLVVGGVAAVAATSGVDLDNTGRFVSMGGAIAVWLGLVVLAPFLAMAALRPLATLVGWRGGPTAKLAVRNALRDPRRTAATASALTVGLGLVCGFAVVGESFANVAGATTRDQVPAGTTVVQPALDGSRLGPEVVTKVRATPGVAAAVALTRAPVEWAAGDRPLGTTSMSPVDPAAFERVLTMPVVEGSGDLRRGAVVLRGNADLNRLDVGDTLTLTVAPGVTRRVPIVGLYRGWEGQPGIFLDEALVPAEHRGVLEAVYAAGSGARAGLDAAFADRPDILVTDRDGLVERLVKGFELVLAVIYAMFGAALVIAVFGVVNTLALSVLERTREIGVLRALGAGRTFVRRVVRRESIVITCYGGALGLLVGIGVGAVMQHVMLLQPLWPVGVPVPMVAIGVVGMVLVGVLAAVWPARRASRADILAAVATE